MAIEEKQRALEFTFVPDDIGGDLKYEITYDDSNPVFPLQISTGGNRMDYPLALFIDVVDFLTSKGVIEPKSYAKTAVMATPKVVHNSAALQQFAPTMPSSAIPIPQVVKGDGSTLTSNTDPLASFDISSQGSVIPPSVASPVAPLPIVAPPADSPGVPPIPQITKADDGGIIACVHCT